MWHIKIFSLEIIILQESTTELTIESRVKEKAWSTTRANGVKIPLTFVRWVLFAKISCMRARITISC